MSEDKKVCFVVMGYGMKTDYASGRTLDLDKTYFNIIKPAVEEAGLICKRADEIKHSGTIDVPMYQYLINADIVIADLSTYNPNAFYELGVRHALKPFTTIAISEQELNPPFDVNHTLIRKYEHMGKDIGYSEVIRFRDEIKELIREILSNPQTDSPVYTYLHGLRPPVFEAGNTNFPNTEKMNVETLSEIIQEALSHLGRKEFGRAIDLLNEANRIDPNNPFIIQKLALATYKNEQPTKLESLFAALSIIRRLPLDTSTDPETLGIAGAINKRIAEETGDKAYLDKSIHYYEKGFYIQNDYYNGINLAFLYNQRGKDSPHNEKIADYVIANRLRVKVIEICLQLTESPSFNEREDKYWVYATLEEAFAGIGDLENSCKYSELSKGLVSNDSWERESTESQLRKLTLLLDIKV